MERADTIMPIGINDTDASKAYLKTVNGLNTLYGEYVLAVREIEEFALFKKQVTHALKVKNHEIKELEQNILYVQSGNVNLGDLCSDIRRKYEMDENEKHIAR